jgi:lysophospholipase L1-like esterase
MPLPETWNLVSPGLDEAVTSPALGRGSHVVDGELVIRQHAFFRADMLSPKATEPVAGVDVDLGPATGVARLLFRGSETRPLFIRLTPGHYMAGGGSWGEWPSNLFRIRAEGGVGRLVGDGGTVELGPASAGGIELTAEAGEAHFRSITLYAKDGSVILQEDYTGVRPGWPVALAGAVLGAVLGLSLRIRAEAEPSPARGVVRAVLLSLPTLAVLAAPGGTWLALVERFYLVRTAAWSLADVALGFAAGVPVAAALVSSGVLRVPEAARTPRDGVWVVAAFGAALLGSRGLEGGEAAAGVLGGAVLLAPWWLARRAGLSAVRALVVDAPALLTVAALGWVAGAWLALAWRALVVVANARSLLDRAPGPAANLAFLGLLAGPPLVEVAVRGSYLGTAWDAARLSGELAPTVGWRDPTPYWSGRCGDGATVKGVVWAGGSSTGGAYQFRNEPTAFFPAQAHLGLCARLSPGIVLASSNFGDGGRDSFTISRTIDTLLDRGAATVVVLYLGVNDLLTTNSTLTRKQREAREAERAAAVTTIARLSSRSRLLTGLGFAFRPPQEGAAAGLTVPDVPIQDAEDNLRTIATAAEKRGAKVLLLTEYTSADMAGQVAPYEALEARLAGELEGVSHLDVRAALEPYVEEGLLVDRNHLSRQGGRRLAEVLAPEVAKLAGL